jgi:transcriptional regulator with XRE-family HTH domain
MANRIRELRKERNMSLRDLAVELNMSFSNIATIERGESQLREDTTKLFADYFNVSSDYLLGLSDNRNNAQITKNPTNLDGVEIEILNEVKELQNKDKEDLLKIIKFMKIKGEL